MDEDDTQRSRAPSGAARTSGHNKRPAAPVPSDLPSLGGEIPPVPTTTWGDMPHDSSDSEELLSPAGRNRKKEDRMVRKIYKKYTSDTPTASDVDQKSSTESQHRGSRISKDASSRNSGMSLAGLIVHPPGGRLSTGGVDALGGSKARNSGGMCSDSDSDQSWSYQYFFARSENDSSALSESPPPRELHHAAGGSTTNMQQLNSSSSGATLSGGGTSGIVPAATGATGTADEPEWRRRELRLGGTPAASSGGGGKKWGPPGGGSLSSVTSTGPSGPMKGGGGGQPSSQTMVWSKKGMSYHQMGQSSLSGQEAAAGPPAQGSYQSGLTARAASSIQSEIRHDYPPPGTTTAISSGGSKGSATANAAANSETKTQQPENQTGATSSGGSKNAWSALESGLWTDPAVNRTPVTNDQSSWGFRSKGGKKPTAASSEAWGSASASGKPMTEQYQAYYNSNTAATGGSSYNNRMHDQAPSSSGVQHQSGSLASEQGAQAPSTGSYHGKGGYSTSSYGSYGTDHTAPSQSRADYGNQQTTYNASYGPRTAGTDPRSTFAPGKYGKGSDESWRQSKSYLQPGPSSATATPSSGSVWPGGKQQQPQSSYSDSSYNMSTPNYNQGSSTYAQQNDASRSRASSRGSANVNTGLEQLSFLKSGTSNKGATGGGNYTPSAGAGSGNNFQPPTSNAGYPGQSTVTTGALPSGSFHDKVGKGKGATAVGVALTHQAHQFGSSNMKNHLNSSPDVYPPPSEGKAYNQPAGVGGSGYNSSRTPAKSKSSVDEDQNLSSPPKLDEEQSYSGVLGGRLDWSLLEPVAPRDHSMPPPGTAGSPAFESRSISKGTTKGTQLTGTTPSAQQREMEVSRGNSGTADFYPQGNTADMWSWNADESWRWSGDWNQQWGSDYWGGEQWAGAQSRQSVGGDRNFASVPATSSTGIMPHCHWKQGATSAHPAESGKGKKSSWLPQTTGPVGTQQQYCQSQHNPTGSGTPASSSRGAFWNSSTAVTGTGPASVDASTWGSWDASSQHYETTPVSSHAAGGRPYAHQPPQNLPLGSQQEMFSGGTTANLAGTSTNTSAHMVSNTSIISQQGSHQHHQSGPGSVHPGDHTPYAQGSEQSSQIFRGVTTSSTASYLHRRRSRRPSGETDRRIARNAPKISDAGFLEDLPAGSNTALAEHKASPGADRSLSRDVSEDDDEDGPASPFNKTAPAAFFDHQKQQMLAMNSSGQTNLKNMNNIVTTAASSAAVFLDGGKRDSVSSAEQHDYFASSATSSGDGKLGAGGPVEGERALLDVLVNNNHGTTGANKTSSTERKKKWRRDKFLLDEGDVTYDFDEATPTPHASQHHQVHPPKSLVGVAVVPGNATGTAAGNKRELPEIILEESNISGSSSSGVVNDPNADTTTILDPCQSVSAPAAVLSLERTVPASAPASPNERKRKTGKRNQRNDGASFLQRSPRMEEQKTDGIIEDLDTIGKETLPLGAVRPEGDAMPAKEDGLLPGVDERSSTTTTLTTQQNIELSERLTATLSETSTRDKGPIDERQNDEREAPETTPAQRDSGVSPTRRLNASGSRGFSVATSAGNWNKPYPFAERLTLFVLCILAVASGGLALLSQPARIRGGASLQTRPGDGTPTQPSILSDGIQGTRRTHATSRSVGDLASPRAAGSTSTRGSSVSTRGKQVQLQGRTSSPQLRDKSSPATAAAPEIENGHSNSRPSSADEDADASYQHAAQLLERNAFQAAEEFLLSLRQESMVSKAQRSRGIVAGGPEAWPHREIALGFALAAQGKQLDEARLLLHTRAPRSTGSKKELPRAGSGKLSESLCGVQHSTVGYLLFLVDGDVRGALEEFLTSAKCQPLNPYPWSNAGVAALYLNQPVAAVESLTRAVALAKARPNLFSVSFFAHNLMVAEGRIPAAEPQLGLYFLNDDHAAMQAG
ncbi:unnamed protein product [Amoebophrya sp. A25]|nr:unnamed protein product [Amoebophrya sp. A25]|eukprot:GSA25T00005334001.1